MAEPLRLYMRVPGTSPMRELLSFLKTVEAGGFDGAGILDSQMICREHLRHAWSGGPADLSHAALPGGDEPVHSSRFSARGREPDGRRDRPGPDEGDHRLGLYVGKHDRAQARYARGDAPVCLDGEDAPCRGGGRLQRQASAARLRVETANPRSDGGLGTEGDRARRGDRRRRDAPRRLQPRHSREGARPSRARRCPLRAATRGLGGDLGGPYRDGDEHRRGATPGAPGRRALGLPRLRRPVARCGRARPAEARDPAIRSRGLS